MAWLTLQTWRRLCACLLICSLASIVWISYRLSRSTNTLGYPVTKQQHTSEEDKPWKQLALRSWRENLQPVNNSEVISGSRNNIPRVVHYVWCGAPSRQFEFRHFLSVRSSISYLRPDIVYFHHDHLPLVDRHGYNTWLWELASDFPFISFTRHDFPFCEGPLHTSSPQWFFLNNLLNQHGGVYVRENTVLIGDLDLTSSIMLVGVMEDNTMAFLAARPHIDHAHSMQGLLEQHTANTTTILCTEQPHFSESDKSRCVRLTEQPLYPRDIFQDDNDMSSIFRELTYGTTNIPQSIRHSDSVVPNVAHIVWYGGGKMTFIFYLSVLSLLHVLKCDDVIIHGDKTPTGNHWVSLQEEKRLHWVYHPRPTSIYGQLISGVEHAADITRADLMLRHGGLHLDPDVLFTRPLPPDLFHYEAVASFDSPLYPMRPFPDLMSMGLTMAQPGGKFWHLYQQSQQFYKDKDWTWNSGRIPYKLYERQPNLLHVEPHLHVICFVARCYPTWGANRQEALRLAEVPETWWREAYAFHLVDAAPQELTSEVTVKTGVGVFAEIGRVILKAAGRL